MAQNLPVSRAFGHSAASQSESIAAASCNPRFFYRGIGFCSLSEAALGCMLERFIPSFHLVTGQTFQIPIGHGRSVDFLINGVLIEYHQPRFKVTKGRCGDFSSSESYREYRREMRKAGRNDYRRRLIREQARRELIQNYTMRRLSYLATCQHFRESELIVVSSREEFYEHVLVRFSGNQALPSQDQFLELFWWWVRLIGKANTQCNFK